MSTPRLVFTSVTNFLYCGDEYLFLHRGPHKKVDANRLNGVGGKVEPGEDFLSAAIRETEEETGYVVKPEQVQLAGIGRLEGGYKEDWVWCFFRIEVPNKKIPLGNHTDDGELMWLHKDEVLTAPYELVDDLRICFPKIAEKKELFFFNAVMSDDEKVASFSLESVPCR